MSLYKKDVSLVFPVIITSTSAAGKDTFLDVLTHQFPYIQVVPRLTTRPPRGNEERTGKYHFVTHEKIISEHSKNKLLFLEENYGGHLYGVYRQDVATALAQGIIPILITNVTDGAPQVLQAYPDSLSIFITPLPEDWSLHLLAQTFALRSQAEAKLRRQMEFLIYKRDRKDIDIEERIARALHDVRYILDYDSIVFNVFDELGQRGPTFQKNYHTLSRFIQREFAYRIFLRQFAVRWLRSKKDGVKLLGLRPHTWELPSIQAIHSIVGSLRAQRKFQHRSEVLEYPVFESVPDKKYTATAAWLHSHFAPGLIAIRALHDFAYWSEISRIQIVRSSGATCSVDVHNQIMTISEGFFSPGRSAHHIHGLVRQLNYTCQIRMAELPAMHHLQAIAQGMCEEKSPRFSQLARQVLSEAKQQGMRVMIGEWARHSDWYYRRLAVECLSVIEVNHPDRRQLLAASLHLLWDPKVGQIIFPVCRLLRRFVAAGYEVSKIQAKIIDLLQDPHRAWARRAMLEVLGQIGTEKSKQAILEELGNTERYDNRLACIEQLSRWKGDPEVECALWYIARFDAVLDVRLLALNIYPSFRQRRPRVTSVPTQAILLPHWIERVQALRQILNQRILPDSQLVLQAITHKNWCVRYTAMPLLFTGLLVITKEITEDILVSPHQSLRVLLRAVMVRKGKAAVPQLLSWLDSSCSWVVITAVQALSQTAQRDNQVRRRLIPIFLKYTNRILPSVVHAAVYFELAVLVRKGKQLLPIRKTLLTQIKTNKNTLERWAILEGLEVREAKKEHLVSLNASIEIRKELSRLIHDFNQRLRREKYGHIVEIVFEDSSYSKEPPLFTRGSDFDVCRIIYTGNIPDSYRTQLRDTICGLGVYVKPDEPEWWDRRSTHHMFRTAVDVSVYHSRRQSIYRPIPNDFVEKKSAMRSRLFVDMAGKQLSVLQKELVRKIHRQYTLNRILQVGGGSLSLQRKDKTILRQLVMLGYVVPHPTDLALYKPAWTTYAGEYLYIE